MNNGIFSYDFCDYNWSKLSTALIMQIIKAIFINLIS